MLRDAGLRVGFLSNNSSMVIADVVAKLAHAGVPADPAEVLTSAVAAGALLGSSLPSGARVLACAGPGVVEALTASGSRWSVSRPRPQWWWASIATSTTTSSSVRPVRCARVRVSSRRTWTRPTPPSDGMIPGTGALVAAVATASSATPEVAGKPEQPTVALVHQRLGTTGVMVGDRPSTDGAMADALGWPFALVLSGVTDGGRAAWW